MKNKELSQLILSVGYIIIAIVILVNFIKQSSDGSQKTKSASQISESAENEIQLLKNQLEQERTINRDLKRILNEMQQAFNPDPLNADTQKFTIKSIDDLKKEGLPTISSKVYQLSEKKIPPDFTKRNPYLPLIPSIGDEKSYISNTELGIQPALDPKIPFLMQTSSNKSNN